MKDKAARTIVETMTADRIDRWVKEAVKAGRRLGYETARGQGDLAALLKKPERWRGTNSRSPCQCAKWNLEFN